MGQTRYHGFDTMVLCSVQRSRLGMRNVRIKNILTEYIKSVHNHDCNCRFIEHHCTRNSSDALPSFHKTGLDISIICLQNMFAGSLCKANLDVGSLRMCISDSKNPQIQQQALTILAAIAPLYPVGICLRYLPLA